jgi:DNA-binding NarL/FixJ family response regulator
VSPAPIRVILADDHTLVRAGVRRILESRPGIVVVSEVADGKTALEAVRTMDAEILVLDLSMPGTDGFEVLRRAKEERPALKVLLLTMYASRQYIARAIQEGADGYLLKDSAVKDLEAAVAAVIEGRPYYSPAIQREMAELLRAPARPPHGIETLTEREREVLTFLVQGLSSKEIGARLDIGTRTVETHRANLMRKLGVRSVALLTQVAIREGLVDPSSP